MSSDTLGFKGSLIIKVFEKGVLVRELGPFKNKVVTSTGYGRNLILRALVGDTTLPAVITTCSVGTGTTAPADSDIGLITPTVTGLPITNYSVSNNVASVDFFIADALLANGTYKEFGLFTATPRLISRLLITPNYTKAAGQDTLFSYTLTATG